MVNVRVLQREVAAIGRAAAWFPLRLFEARRDFDPTLAHPTPIVFAHGFCGHRTNFRGLQRTLAARGVANVAYFDYPPRIDWPRLAVQLGETIEAVRRETGVRRVDVVGHSLGGLVGRYLVDMARDAPVRRLVTLGSPYFGSPMPRNELALFGASDPLVPVPSTEHGPHAPHLRPGGRVVVVPDCGHWGLLVHERVGHEVTRFLTSPNLALTHDDPTRSLGQAS